MADSTELANEVQKVLSRYVDREVPLDVAQEELERLAPDLAELSADRFASWAADHAEILIAEVLRSHRSEDEVRRLIRDEILLPSVEVVQSSTASTISATETPETSESKVAVTA